MSKNMLTEVNQDGYLHWYYRNILDMIAKLEQKVEKNLKLLEETMRKMENRVELFTYMFCTLDVKNVVRFISTV